MNKTKQNENKTQKIKTKQNEKQKKKKTNKKQQQKKPINEASLHNLKRKTEQTNKTTERLSIVILL